MADGKLIIETDLDSGGIEKGISNLTGTVKTGAKAAGMALTAVSASITACGGYAVKTGIEFESAFAGIKKTVDGTPEQIAELREDIIEMSKEIPQSAAALSEIGEAAGQLGIQTENIEDFTRVMANMGVSTNMSATDAATSLARLANITGMPQDKFENLGSTVVALGNSLATTEDEIVSMGLRLAGAGSQVGMTEAQIMSFSAALSSVGIEAEAGGSAFSKVIIDMQLAVEQGGESLDDFAKVAGMSADEFKTAFKEDAASAIISFIKGLSTCEERGISAIGVLDDMGISEVRMRDALLRASGASDVFTQAIKTGTEAWKDNTALAKEASQRYETLESKLTLLKNGADALAIAFKDSIDDGLRGAVNAGIGYVDQLTDAFNSGGLESAVEAAGDIFGDLAVKAAEKAPGMVDASTSFIQAFINGIAKNKGKLVTAAKEIVKTLVSGLVEILPNSVKKPAQDAVEALTKSFNSGGLKSAVKTVEKLIESLGRIISNVADISLPLITTAIDFLGNHLDEVTPLIISVTTAFAAYKAVTNIINAVTAAQLIFNAAMSASPIGIAVAAIAGLSAGLVVVGDLFGTDAQELSAFNNEMATNAERVRESAKARQEAVADISTESTYHQKLWEELQTIVDANGQIQEGYEERATFITSELSDALGVEIEIIDGVIQDYQNLNGTIEQLIETKRAEALIDVYKEDYTQAIRDQQKALEDVSAAYNNLSEKKEYYNELQERQREGESGLEGELNYVQLAIEECEQAYQNANTTLAEYNTTIKNYEDTIGAVESGSDRAGIAVLKLTNDFKDASFATKEELQAQYESIKSSYEQMKQAVAEGGSGITQQQLSDMELLMALATQEWGQYGQISAEEVLAADAIVNEAISNSGNPEAAKKEGQETSQAKAEGIAEGTAEVTDAVEEQNAAADAAYRNADSTAASESAQENVDAYVESTLSGTDDVSQASTELTNAANTAVASADMTTSAQAAAQDAINTLTVTLENATEQVKTAGKMLGQAVSSGIQAANIGSVGSALVGSAVAQMNAAVSSQAEALKESGQAIGNAFVTGINSVSIGTKLGKSATTAAQVFIQAFTSKQTTATNTGCSFATAVNVGAIQANLISKLKSYAVQAVNGFVQAISSGYSMAYTASVTLATGASSGLASQNLYGTAYNYGSSFVTGFTEGISQNAFKASAQAAAMASAALVAAKSELAINSPSKKTRVFGREFDEGFIVGIEDNERDVINTAKRLNQNMLNQIDAGAFISRMRRSVSMTSGRVTQGVTGSVNNLYRNQDNDSKKYQDADIRSLAEELGTVIADEISNMEFLFDDRELGRMVRKVT